MLQRLTTWVWRALVLGIVLLAVYSSFGRLLLGNLSQYQSLLLESVNERLSLRLEIDELRGSWRSLSPRITATGVRLRADTSTPAALLFDELVLEIDVWSSVASLSPRLHRLRAIGGELQIDVSDEGAVSLHGLPPPEESGGVEALREFILNAYILELTDTQLTLHSGGASRQSQLEGRLERDGDFRRASITVEAPERNSRFQITGEGRGSLRSLERFDGMFHLHSTIGDISHYSDLLELVDVHPLSGNVRNDVWLRLSDGAVEWVAEVDATNLSLRQTEPVERNIDLDTLSVTLGANLRKGRWHFQARDFSLSRSEREVRIDRLSGVYGDDSLTLRLADLQLGTLSDYLRTAGLLPETAEDVLAKLSPSGKLSSAEFTLEELSSARDWQLAMNFSELDVEPWKGAPGLVNASGYAELQADRGRVQLGSSDFSMSFPKVFREPLDYSEVSAELVWSIDDDAFRIRSGRFTARGEEGDAVGVFALKLPRSEQPAGAEMDLMVSLQDTDSRYRDKYLSFKLSPTLLAWLEDSVDSGRVAEAGFIYRGSLIRRPKRRTVQLYLDIEDARIKYHPDWPAAESFDGRILIDDATVDVYGRRGRILDSSVEFARIALRPNADASLRLALSAKVTGAAQDGLDVVNQSPLREIVGDSFSDWELEGDLVSELALEMDLKPDAAAPLVTYDGSWDAVTVSMTDLDLALEDVSGAFQYDSQQGFQSKALEGQLWGQDFVGSVTQGRQDNGLAPLDIALRGAVSADSVKDWLDLDALRLAVGETAAELHIKVPAEGAPQLTVTSDLHGVALDLPGPWAKTAEERNELQIVMPLTKETKRLELMLDGAAFLGIDLGSDGMTGGSLGFGRPQDTIAPGRFWLGGNLETLDWDAWELFLDTYLAGESEMAVLAGLRDLQIGELRLFQRRFKDVLLSGRQEESNWTFDFTTDWVEGAVRLPDDLAEIELELRRMDMSALTAFTRNEQGLLNVGAEALPPMRIAVDQLYSGGTLLGDLSFTLRETAPNLHFENIRGELQHLQLGGDQGMRLDWLRGEGAEQTRLMGDFSFLNFGEVLKDFNYEEIVETNSGRVGLEMQWLGDPGAFGLDTLQGRMTLDVDDGRFLKTSGAAEGTLRVVGILNLTEVVRRLSLDLSNVYKSGVPFDRIDGELIFDAGHVEVPRLDVRSRSSRLQFAGTADIAPQTVEGELVATLPIASNLPWMFALVSGLPAAAGVYVISKLFDDQMDRFSSAVYRVDGSWSDPNVDFQRIFDNRPGQEEEVNELIDAAVEAEGSLENPAEGSSHTTAEGSSGSGIADVVGDDGVLDNNTAASQKNK